MTTKTSQNINSEFLLNLVLEENKHLNVIDFLDKCNGSHACVCVSLALAEKYHEIKKCFTDSDIFAVEYFMIYANALEKYHIITKNEKRQVFIDEGLTVFPIKIFTHTFNNLITNKVNGESALSVLETIKNNSSYAIILRDEIAFIVIHWNENDFIVIDPHVEYCGIMTQKQIHRYVTYDGIWDFSVSLLVPIENNNNTEPVENNNNTEPIENNNNTEPIENNNN